MDGTALERVLAWLPGNPNRARLAAQEIGWRKLVDESRRAGLLPLLARLLDSQMLKVDERRAHQFAVERHANAQRGCLRALNGKGIPFVVLKGWVVAHALYPDPWLRRPGDVDLLVQESEVDRAVAALQSAGWMLISDPRLRPLDYQHSVNLRSREGVLVELHYRLRTARCEADYVSDVFRRAVRGRFRSEPMWEMDVTDALLFEAVHLATHGFEGARWLFELKLRILRQVDWKEFVERADVEGLTKPALASVRICAQKLQCPVPKWVLDKMRLGRFGRAATSGLLSLPKRARPLALDIVLFEASSGNRFVRACDPLVKRIPSLRRWREASVERARHAACVWKVN